MPWRSTEGLIAGLKRFQEREGVEVTGVLDKITKKKLEQAWEKVEPTHTQDIGFSLSLSLFLSFFSEREK